MKVINETKLNQILEFIKTFQIKEGRSPSYRQIAKIACFPSLATAQKYVKILQSRGLIERNDLGRIVTPTRLDTEDTIVAPLVGKVACGKPILAVENIEGNFRLPKKPIPIFCVIFTAFRSFRVRNRCFRMLLQALFPRSPKL